MRKRVLTVFSLIVLPLLTMANDLKAPALPKDVVVKASVKALVVEQTYLMKVYRLDKPLKLSIDQFPEERARTIYPHAVLQEQYAAMKAGDYSRFMQTWTVVSQKQINDRNDKANRRPEFWLNAWSKSLKEISLEVRTLIAYGRFTLVEYALVDAQGRETAKDTVAFVMEQSRWLMTQELASDPVLAHWDHPLGRVQVPPSSMIPK